MTAINTQTAYGEIIRVNGIVQGVGFRPTVWHLAKEIGIQGSVCNDAKGVLIYAWGSQTALDNFIERLQSQPPPLARIDRLERSPISDRHAPDDFQILSSREGDVHTDVTADAATCTECLKEVQDSRNRRYRYPFTNCTHCGPRLSIINAIPYDRANTSMASFCMCVDCQNEYDDPANRRFHAQPNACAECGPRLWLEDKENRKVSTEGSIDEIDAACKLIEKGHIVAIKGIGGFHLACDALNGSAVRTLRERKQRYHKAFALMATDVKMLSQYAKVSEQELILLQDKTAPVVVLEAKGKCLPDGIAPGQNTLGFMLPYTPLHHLLMAGLQRPIVLTSGNRSDEPQCISNEDARDRLQDIADYWLLHDRDIVNRLDDSVLRIADHKTQTLRRARGFAPESIPLPDGFAQAPSILAMGGELKNTFCYAKHGMAILSQHIGDLEDITATKDYRHNLKLYDQLFDHDAEIITVDKHPDYLSTKLGKEMAGAQGLQLQEVQHHHAHVAAVMAEHGLSLDTKPIIGVAMDGLGYGEDGTIWGGEFLLTDYAQFKRLACFQPMPMPGGVQSIREPWRNTFAHFYGMDWQVIEDRHSDLEIVRYLGTQSLDTLKTIIDKKLNSPLSSSCGRLFDAVAAAIGVCRESISYEGQAAIELEAMASPVYPLEKENAYPFSIIKNEGMHQLCWESLWQALISDLQDGQNRTVIAARFHHGLSLAIVEMIKLLCQQYNVDTVVLSGGVFQNQLLLEGVSDRLANEQLTVLSPIRLPANDGGLSFGQVIIAAAKSLQL